MKVGLSTYSLLNDLNSGEMTVLDVIDWIAANGGEHIGDGALRLYRGG